MFSSFFPGHPTIPRGIDQRFTRASFLLAASRQKYFISAQKRIPQPNTLVYCGKWRLSCRGHEQEQDLRDHGLWRGGVGCEAALQSAEKS